MVSSSLKERDGRDAGLLHGGDHLEPPLIGQPIIHHGDLEVFPAGHLPRLRARACGDHTPPLPGERPPQMQPLLVVPYHKQYRCAQNATPTFAPHTPNVTGKYIHKSQPLGTLALRDDPPGGIMCPPMRS